MDDGKEKEYPAASAGSSAVTGGGSITVVNFKYTITLPSTGGPGTNMIYLIGITLLSLAGTGFLMKRRRRHAV